MSANPLPKVESNSGPAAMAELFRNLAPLFGSGTTKTSNNSTSSADPNSMGQADELLQRILGGGDSGAIDDMVANILTRAKQEFGPALIQNKAAGVRTYSDTTLASMRNEAMARATGEAAQAKLNAMNAANKTAAGLVEAKINATRSTQQQQQQKTGISPAGKVGTALLSGAVLANNLRKTKPVKDAMDSLKNIFSGPEQASIGDFSSGGGFESSDFDAIYSSGASDSSALNVADGFGDEPSLDTLEQQLAELDQPEVPVADINDPNTVTAGTEGVAGVTLDAGSVVTGLPMPPAPTIDPATGEIIPRMPAATFDMPAAVEDAELLDGAEEGAEIGIDSATTATDLVGEGSGEIAGEAAGEAIGDLYFPGMFTVFNVATEGQLGEAVGQIADAGEDIIGSFGDVGEDIIGGIANNVTDFVDDIFGGCFMTTAATLGGELDNGYTLETMREFRKSYMQATPERASEVLDYYILAPFVVKRINESPLADKIWEKVRNNFLVPCVTSFNLGMPEETHRIYKEMMYWARQQVGLANAQGVH